MFDLLIQQYVARDGLTEDLKALNQMEWVRRMNGIRAQVEENISEELILTNAAGDEGFPSPALFQLIFPAYRDGFVRQALPQYGGQEQGRCPGRTPRL